MPWANLVPLPPNGWLRGDSAHFEAPSITGS